ncbi:MAG: hypothetical protein J6O88_15935 [Chryseobacterium sp.]|uniref:hypothetical protein n=1 Tax=Chryseobacterium sp. TaxID=1871047 RepID=UPI001B2BF3F8|nr:hypothetical protein [Chryseobacterium sp.]MBO6186149.1 hypothetical protein [Chryseobacterium sp.]
MIITNDIKDELLTCTKLIEDIEVVYKKKKKYNGVLSAVKNDPFEVTILDQNNKEDIERIIDFDLAEQITLTFFDGTVKTYQDEVV